MAAIHALYRVTPIIASGNSRLIPPHTDLNVEILGPVNSETGEPVTLATGSVVVLDRSKTTYAAQALASPATEIFVVDARRWEPARDDIYLRFSSGAFFNGNAVTLVDLTQNRIAFTSVTTGNVSRHQPVFCKRLGPFSLSGFNLPAAAAGTYDWGFRASVVDVDVYDLEPGLPVTIMVNMVIDGTDSQEFSLDAVIGNPA